MKGYGQQHLKLTLSNFFLFLIMKVYLIIHSTSARVYVEHSREGVSVCSRCGAENPSFSTSADAHSLAARDASDAWWLHILSYPHRIDDRDFDDLKQRHHGE